MRPLGLEARSRVWQSLVGVVEAVAVARAGAGFGDEGRKVAAGFRRQLARRLAVELQRDRTRRRGPDPEMHPASRLNFRADRQPARETRAMLGMSVVHAFRKRAIAKCDPPSDLPLP